MEKGQGSRTLGELPIRTSLIRLTLVVSSLLWVDPVAFATETDQFTTPTKRLHDIGPALSRRVVEIIESDRTGDAPEQVLSKRVGRSLLVSRLTRWVKRIRSDEAPVTFRPSVFASIYRTALSPVPTSFWFDAPTVYAHGYYMGADKIDHFFRQGHDYYKIVMRKQGGRRRTRGRDRRGGCPRREAGTHLLWNHFQWCVLERRPGSQLRGHEVLPESPSAGCDR